LALARKSLFNELSVEDYKSLHAKFSEDVVEVFDFEASVERRASISGPNHNRLPSCDSARPTLKMAYPHIGSSTMYQILRQRLPITAADQHIGCVRIVDKKILFRIQNTLQNINGVSGTERRLSSEI
jgi:hypothetical protein